MAREYILKCKPGFTEKLKGVYWLNDPARFRNLYLSPASMNFNVTLIVSTDSRRVSLQVDHSLNIPEEVVETLGRDVFYPDVIYNGLQLRFEIHRGRYEDVFIIFDKSGNGSIREIAMRMGLID